MGKRRQKAQVRSVGGNASINAKQYSVTISTKWAKAMEFTKDDRMMKMVYDRDNKKITITKVINESDS